MSEQTLQVTQQGEELELRRKPPIDGSGTEVGLKPERIQELLTAAMEAALGPVSAWARVRGGAAMSRSFGFADATSAFAFAQVVTALGSATNRPLFVRLADTQVILALQGGETPCLPGAAIGTVSPAMAG
jgi:pterin-4a-carbinolamine dehydratase